MANRVSFRIFGSVVLAGLFGLVPHQSVAQGSLGGGASLRGVVTDQSGAVIPTASLTMTNIGTAISQTIRSDDRGRYLFHDLQPAIYTLTAVAPGFSRLKRTDVELRVGQQATIDVNLLVGQNTRTVVVTSESPLLDTVNASLGQEVTNRYITEVPLLNRDIANLAFLVPGVTQTGGHNAGNGGAVSVDQTGINFVSNGQRNSTTEVRLDGNLTSTPETGEGGLFQVFYQPIIENVKEFNFQNNGFSAEWGSNGGSVINMVSNSGTNQLHGAAYWFGRRAALDANDFFADRAGLQKPDLSRDQFGGAIGGPIIKDRTFYFFDFEKVREFDQITSTSSVPTLAQRRGDFSSTYNQDGSLVKIYEPYNFVPGTAQRIQFPGNMIPLARQSPIAQNIMKYYPLPNTPGDPTTQQNNFTGTGVTSSPDYQFDIRIDHSLTPSSNILGRYSLLRQGGDYGGPIYHNAADRTTNVYGRVQNAVVSDTWTITPHVLWMNLFGIDRAYETSRPVGFDPTSLGFPNILTSINHIDVFPSITATNYATLGAGGYAYTTDAHTQFLVDSSFSVDAGAHNLKFGTELRIDLVNYDEPAYPAGWFQFNAASTRHRLYGSDPTTGNPIASLLADAGNIYSFGAMGISPGTATKSRENSMYVQDDWKATQKLTVNLGLRYEWSTPFTERHNLIQFLNPTESTGVSVPGLGLIRGVADFATPSHRRLGSDLNNFAPRLGFAYAASAKTVFRAAAGIYYGVSPNTNSAYSGPAFSSNATWEPSLDGGFTQYATLENPYPNGIPLPQGKKYGKLNMWGYSSFGSIGPVFRNPEIYQWTASIQQELSGSMLFEIAYSGNKSTHLPFNGTDNINFVSKANRLQYGDDGLNNLVDNPFYSLFQGPGAIFNEPASTYNQPQIPQINLLRPYPQFDGSFYGSPQLIASAKYNALQFRLEKRFTHGLNFITSYTWSKERDDSSAGNDSFLGNYTTIQDPTDLQAEWSIGGSDTPQRFVFGGSYVLPVGRGKMFGKDWNTVVSAILGDWQINAFLTLQSGIPLSLTMASPDLADGSQRPNIQGNIRGAGIDDTVNGKGIVFNAAAFSAPPSQVAGNAPRFESVVRGDGVHNLDFSLFKVLPIRERFRLELRAEAFNATNSPQFGIPDTSYGSPTFGTINSQNNNPRQMQFGARLTF